ncbi:MAG TPA: acyl-CoA dehydrogenase family protein [Acidimicrobiia bacterium]|jgi:alkylation response protein AidB-like acyl-CoA dehydrogenase|nr:acyl-CoA dehydrogenase family protein [Acidimicrobiia bacterium]
MDAGLDRDTLSLVLDTIRDFGENELPDTYLLELDEKDEFPEPIVRQMLSELGVSLLFIPEQYGGMGAGTFDIYRVCELLARIDVGVATGVFATFLGSDPIVFGGTEAQKERWMTRIAEEGLLMAYGATEPEAGSDLGALKTTAKPIEEDGEVVAYLINGNKQWISNGTYADLYTILANAPGGPTWFVVDRDVEGFEKGKPEDKHGIRASNTAALSLQDVRVDADRIVGEGEGLGLVQAQLVFGYTRLMVAAFGLGAGWAALDRSIPYSVDRIQGGSPLSEKQGYTHKLIVPHAVRLEAARAYIEETAQRIDAGEGTLNTEGAIAKYMGSEAGNAAAEAAIQAHGGYGYTKEYMVEKIKRDVKITTIYEGTSEIMEMTIARDRWQEHLKSRGAYYHDQAAALEALAATAPGHGADIAALAHHALAGVMEHARAHRLTRNQHVLFRLGDLVAAVESSGALARRAAAATAGRLPDKADTRFSPTALAAVSRVYAREAAARTASEGMRWVLGAADPGAIDAAGLEAAVGAKAIEQAQGGLIADMDAVADALYGRAATD